jgi:hypothetical protein
MSSRTQWLIYKDDSSQNYKVKEQATTDEVLRHHIHYIDDEGYTMKTISRNETMDVFLTQNNEYNHYRYQKPYVFQKMNDKELTRKLDKLYGNQEMISVNETNESNTESNNNIWSSFKHKPIRLLKVSKSDVSLEKKPEEVPEQKQKQVDGFKRINASFGSSLRNHRRQRLYGKRKRDNDDDEGSDKEDDNSKYASVAVSYDDIVKKR